MPAITFSPESLHRLRTDRGISPTVLAAATGRTADAILGYESGRFAPTAEALGRLADALGCSVADLFTSDTVGAS